MIKNNYSIYEKDITSYENIIAPKLSAGKRPNLLCSFTYITPNYTVIHTIKELAKLEKEGYMIHLILWDINSLTHRYSRNHNNPNIYEFTNERIKEVKGIAKSFGMNEEFFKIHKSSELWKRLILISKPPLFQEMYEIMTDIRVKDLAINEKISHLMQMPADMFVANYFHVLCPEEIDKPIDVFYFNRNKETLHKKVREEMFRKGLTNMERPVFLIAENLPYLIFESSLPEWNLGIDEITYIVTGKKPTVEESKTLVSLILSEVIGEFKVTEGEERTGLSTEELIKKIPKMKKRDLYITLAENLYIYLQKVKSGVVEKTDESELLHVYNKKKASDLGKILKSKIYLEIILLADGTKNTTEIAKRLKKQVSNISVYINQLKNMGFVRIVDGKVKRSFKGVNMNFEVGLRTE
ncbi:MAG: ArsR family transcriptional regulator [Nanoarchaeota archaeon]